MWGGIQSASRLPNILAYTLGCTSVALALAQTMVSCHTCGTIFGAGLLLFPLVVLLCVVTPRKAPHRFRPTAIAFLGLVLSTLFLH